MKKYFLAIGSVVLSLSLFAGSAFGAAAGSIALKSGSKVEKRAGSGVPVKTGEDESTVTDATYGEGKGEQKGHKGYTGLQRAYENVKDKPAGAVIAALLKDKYDITVQDSVYALTDAAEELAAEGDLTTAIEVQREAVKTDVTQVESYKTLTKMLKKNGKTGVVAYINGEELVSDVAPVIKSGRTLVPVSAISKGLKAEVAWDAKTQTVTITRNGVTVKLVIGSNKAYVNGKQIVLDVPAELMNSRTMVPVSFVSKALSVSVKWEPETTSVIVYEDAAAPTAE